jgi:hypothetical protein
MAAVTDSVQQSIVPLKISTDAGTTKKSIVCLQEAGFSFTTATTEEVSQCGTHTGKGASSWEYTTTIIVNTAPTAETEVSYADLLALAVAKTDFLVYDQHPSDGSDWYQSGTVFISNLTKTGGAEGLVKASMTLKGSGTLDIAV